MSDVILKDSVKGFDISNIDLLNLISGISYTTLVSLFKLKENKDDIMALGSVVSDRLIECIKENNINEFCDILLETTEMFKKVIKTDVPEKAGGVIDGIKDLFLNFKEMSNMEKIKKVVSIIDLFAN